jgi:hypothetical protein
MGGLERVLAGLRDRGLQPRQCGAGWTCRCPAHDDRTPSLSIHPGADGRVLVNCHAGCPIDAVCAAIGLRVADLFEPDPARSWSRARRHSPATRRHPPATRRRGRSGGSDGGDSGGDSGAGGDGAGTVPGDGGADGDAAPAGGRGRIFPAARDAAAELERHAAGVGVSGPPSATWTYTDAAGEPVGLVVRWDGPGGGKMIRPVSRLADGSGWIIGAMPTPRPLYRLPDLLATGPGERVYVVEGEKAADAGRAIGLTTTTSPHGSRSAARADWSPLAGRDVVILPDRDHAGERYAADAARLCLEAGARSVRVVRLAARWPDLPPGGDLADLAERTGGDAGALDDLRRDIEALADGAAPVDPAGPIRGAPVLRRLADVKAEPVEWLWPGRIALGKLTLVAGDPGLGKSFLTLDLAARVSTGAGWPDRPGERPAPGGVVLLSAEDGVADTIRPRLDAARADVSRIVALEAVREARGDGHASDRAFDLSRDLPALEAAVRRTPACRLVVIDPVTAYLGAVDSHRNAEVRALLAPLGRIAERHRVAVVAVTHLNKSASGPAIYRAMGSLAFAAAARAAWAVSADANDPRRRLLLPIKNNLAPDAGGLAYRIEPVGAGGGPALAWEPDPVTVSADDALAGDRDHGGDRTERDDAAAWLHEFLGAGPRLAREVVARARAEGFSRRTLERAKAAAGIRARKEAFGNAWVWEWPGVPRPAA